VTTGLKKKYPPKHPDWGYAEIRNVLSPLLARCGVDIYFSGHEHLSQSYLVNLPQTQPMYTFGLGSSGKVDGEIIGNQKLVDQFYGDGLFTEYFAEQSPSFGHVVVTKQKINVQFIDMNGLTMYEVSVLPKPGTPSRSLLLWEIVVISVLGGAASLMILFFLCCRQKRVPAASDDFHRLAGDSAKPSHV